MHRSNGGISIGLVDIENIGSSTIGADYVFRISKRYKKKEGDVKRTLAAHRQIKVADGAVLTKDLVQMILIDCLG